MKNVDERFALGYGSAWHLLRSLGYHRNEFNRRIAAQLRNDGVQCDVADIHWLDFHPRKTNIYYRCSLKPILDDERTRLDFLGDDHALQADYDEFWPTSGSQQNWDAIGQATIDGRQEWLLVEAKAHTGEIRADGTDAGKASRDMIEEKAFCPTKQALGVDPDANWLDHFYQYANRMATLFFLNTHNEPARLLFVYFLGDSFPDDPGPKTAAGWQDTLCKVDKALGLTGQSELENRIHKVFVPVTLDDSR